MKTFVYSALLLGVLALSFHLDAITWCHDYSWYKATGKDANRTSPDSLRKQLKKLGYKMFPFTNAAQNPKAQAKLKSGDVIIFGNDHSGVVNSKGLIDHFLQKAGASGVQYAVKDIDSLSSMMHDWTLLQLVNFERVTPEGAKLHPYQNKSVEVWRKP
jgi:hypothetical protein